MNKLNNKNRKLFFIVVILLSAWIAQAVPTGQPPTVTQQQRQITGTVVEQKNGEPIVGASVVVKGTTNGVITDIDGKFNLNVSQGSVIVISFIGFTSQEITIQEQTTLKVQLVENAEDLEEVVVVGYGTQKKVNLTGSVGVVSAKALEARPISNVGAALSGTTSGMYAYQPSGAPDSDGVTIRIRGSGSFNNNSPLVIIDGLEGVLNTVNPNDIESMSILKDAASSAIYGARAANGVILITTKKGSKGKVNVTFSSTLSIAKPSHLPEFVNNSAEYMRIFNKAKINFTGNPKYNESAIEKWIEAESNPNGLTAGNYPNYLAYPNTNWADAIFENNIVQNYNLSVAGANEKTKYMLSAGYMDNPGVIDHTGMERYQMRINLESKVSNRITLGTNTSMQTQLFDMGNYSTGFSYLTQKVPSLYPYQHDGYWATVSDGVETSQMGSVLQQIHTTAGKDQTTRVNTTLFAKLNIIEGLTIESKVNYAIRFNERRARPISYSAMDFSTGTVTTPPTPPDKMTTSYSFNKNYQITFDNVIRYSKAINHDHHVSVLAGHNEYYYNYYNTAASKLGLIDETIYVFDSAGETNNQIAGSENDRAMRSFFGRVNYDYKSKYLVEFNLRSDGSSRFGKNSRWGTFPGASAGWRISEEAFMANMKDKIQNLKLRLSWGKLGNDAAGNYDYQAMYSTVNYSFNGIPIIGLAEAKMANSFLRWETTRITGAGIDATFFNNRANLELDYYDKYSYGLLTTPSIYPEAGNITGPTMNTADIRNNGVEVALGWRDQIGKVKYGIRGNFTYNKNRVVKYLGKYEVFEDGTNNLGDVASSTGNNPTVEDHMLSEFYLRKTYKGTGTYFNLDGTVDIKGGPTAGMIRTEEDMNWVEAMKEAGYRFSPSNSISRTQLYYGDLIYDDLNGDGLYGSNNDREFLNKSTTPKYIFGLSMDAEWNGFDFSMHWAGNMGMYYYLVAHGLNSSTIIDSRSISRYQADESYYYNFDDHSDINNNLNAKNPRLTNNGTASNTINQTASEHWLYNASYIKLKNLQLGYTFPSHLTNRLGVQKVRVFFNGENLLTITPYKFSDPEGGANLHYPTLKQYAFGINVNF